MSVCYIPKSWACEKVAQGLTLTSRENLLYRISSIHVSGSSTRPSLQIYMASETYYTQAHVLAPASSLCAWTSLSILLMSYTTQLGFQTYTKGLNCLQTTSGSENEYNAVIDAILLVLSNTFCYPHEVSDLLLSKPHVCKEDCKVKLLLKSEC